MKDTAAALSCWQKAIQIRPTHHKAWANLLALLDNDGRTDDVIATAQLAETIFPNDAVILFSRANAYGKLGRFAEAEQLYRRCIRLRPLATIYHVNLGVLYHRWNKLDAAIDAYRAALRIDPAQSSARTNLARVLRVSTKN